MQLDRRFTFACLAGLAAALAGVALYGHYLAASDSIDRRARKYTALVLALGAHDADSIDAPVPATRGDQQGVRGQTPSLEQIAAEARDLAARLRRADTPQTQPRAAFLVRQLEAVALRAEQLGGGELSRHDELRRMLGFDPHVLNKPPPATDVYVRLEHWLPGDGALSSRLRDYDRRFVVPRGRLHRVVTRAVAACREQTRRHITLPPDEALDITYVAGQPWSGYSHYQGGLRSTMRINRALPLTVDQILTLACHEAYPGHHLYNVLRDRHLARGLGMREAAAVLPVFSPEGFRAEALATAAASIAFTRDERVAVLRRELFPAAGLDPGEVERYVDVRAAVDELGSEIGYVIGDYLSARIDRREAAARLRHRALMEHAEATLAYVDRYRAYALAYTLGREWLRPMLDGAQPGDRWRSLELLILATHSTHL